MHDKGLFRCTAAFLDPADLAAVASLSMHLSCRSGYFGGGRERPRCFWPWFGRGAVACFHGSTPPLRGSLPSKSVPAGRRSNR